MSDIGNKAVFAKNLKYYIEKSGKDRKELAAIWGFPYSTVTEWINAKKYPRIDRVEIMADYFGILKSDLIEDKPEQKEKPTVKDDGFTEGQRKLIAFAEGLTDDQIEMLIRVSKTILGRD